jgi:hypothetical protein
VDALVQEIQAVAAELAYLQAELAALQAQLQELGPPPEDRAARLQWEQQRAQLLAQIQAVQEQVEGKQAELAQLEQELDQLTATAPPAAGVEESEPGPSVPPTSTPEVQARQPIIGIVKPISGLPERLPAATRTPTPTSTRSSQPPRTQPIRTIQPGGGLLVTP